MQLLLRILAVVAATLAVPLSICCAMSGGASIDVAARALIWIMLAVALWSIAVVRQRLDDLAGG